MNAACKTHASLHQAARMVQATDFQNLADLKNYPPTNFDVWKSDRPECQSTSSSPNFPFPTDLTVGCNEKNAMLRKVPSG